MSNLWDRFQKYFVRHPQLGFSLDISRMRFGDGFFADTFPLAKKAFVNMKDLEAGKIVNPDENRMVGHYWLRAPQLAPTSELRDEISACNSSIKQFVDQI